MAGLRQYRDKRDFLSTREPRGTLGRDGGRSDGHLYVIQKHAARRLHYDLRLELDGVLKSWAVTRGPSLDPAEKRLAVEVEDHPIEYAGFEGTIPQGQYGGGRVIVWDNGTWTPESDPHQGLAKGHLDFVLNGQKLRGRWHLVRMGARPGEKRNNWLLIKGRDAFAAVGAEADILDRRSASVLTGRPIEQVGEGDDVWDSSKGRRASPHQAAAERKAATENAAARRGRARASAATVPVARRLAGGGTSKEKPAAPRGGAKAPMPDFIPPCLATAKAKPPEGDRFVHEIKFDGYRLQAHIESGTVRLYTRRGLDWTARFGEQLSAALSGLKIANAIIDGEVVVESEAGASDFSLLQAALSEGETGRFVFYGFDLLYVAGRDLRAAPLRDRKEALKRLLPQVNAGPLRYSEHFTESGALVLRHACGMGLEGIVSKLLAAPYRSGRSSDWIKSKCFDRQEFVIVGYVPSTVAQGVIGSLVLGYYEDGTVVYAGRVGTGFPEKTARDLFRKLDAIAANPPPFAARLAAGERRGVTWTRPEYVAEVEFRGWTGARVLRQASFIGLREDKAPAEVVRENPSAVPVRPPSSRAATFGVKLTHPDRIYWPDTGVTKQGLADYYAQAWKWIGPHVVHRPLSLLRCPDGIEETCFFQKQPWRGIHDSVTMLPNPGPGGDKLLAIDSLDGLVALVQGGVLEIHPWGASLADLDHPDRLIFDLDPGPGVPWSAVVTTAIDVRDRLQHDGLESFVKTTGGKGLHVVAPLIPKAGWDEAKAYAHALADALMAENPKLFAPTMAKREREGRIFIDYLRNGRGATAVAPYSTRARAGAPVSTPVAWDELSGISGGSFRLPGILNRLAHQSRDPWAGFLKLKQRLPDLRGASKPGRSAR